MAGSAQKRRVHRKVAIPTLKQIDTRTRAGRHALAVRDRIRRDLGGEDQLSAMQLELIDRAAVLSCLLNSQEASWLNGGEIDPNAYCTVTNTLSRTLGALGLQRVARDVTIGLPALLRRKAQERASAVAA